LFLCKNVIVNGLALKKSVQKITPLKGVTEDYDSKQVTMFAKVVLDKVTVFTAKPVESSECRNCDLY
jgi:hypothetical protein